MKISFNWLKEFVNIPKNISPEVLASKLMSTTVEIEKIEKKGEWLNQIIVGQVLEVKKHPNADRLSLTKVDIGGGKILNIVCGAPNVSTGQKVAVALPGTVMANGLKLEKKEVRGIMSEGMICAEDELGLGSGHLGIIVLPEKAKPGQKLTDVLPVCDVIYEIDNKSLTNRPDLWGHYGIAREVAAILGQKLKTYKVSKNFKVGKEANLQVKVQNKKLCPRYLGVVVDNIKIAPSPDWLRWRLESVGIRAINNIVDITNYVMLELGQPLHAFDFNKVEADKRGLMRILVREARSDEDIVTIDGIQRKLDQSMLVIADSEKPIAIAGVMGGENSEIDEKTTTIILESANFDAVSIRKTSLKLGLRTEASMRFEKGLDPNLAELGMAKALELIMVLCREAKISKIVDIKNFKLDQGPIKLSLDFLNQRIGQAIPRQKVVNILKSLGFGITSTGKELKVEIPTWRAMGDIHIPEDLVEEVARIYGYEKIISKMPEVSMQPPEVNLERVIERKIKNILIGLGLTEVHNYSFVEEKVLLKTKFNPAIHIRLINPIAKNLSHLRQSLVPNLILNISQNQHFFDKIKLLEIGTVFFKEPGEEKIGWQTKKFLPRQVKFLAGVFQEKGNLTPFYIAKEVAEILLNVLNINYSFDEAHESLPWLHPSRSLSVKVKDQIIGFISELHPEIQNNFEIKEKVGIFEFNFNDLVKFSSGKRNYQPIPKYPSIELDLAVVVPRKILWEDIKRTVLICETNLIREVKLFDVYEGKEIGEGEKSLAFRVVYRSDERTLKLEEAKEIETQIIQKLNQKFGAKLRT